MVQHSIGKLLLIGLVSLVAGVVIVPVLFFGTWGLVSVVLEALSRLQDNVWSLLLIIHYVGMFFLLGWLVRRWLSKKQWSARSMYMTLWICVPMTLWLYLFAALTDGSTVEYIPRFAWIAAPLVGYVLGLMRWSRGR